MFISSYSSLTLLIQHVAPPILGDAKDTRFLRIPSGNEKNHPASFAE